MVGCNKPWLGWIAVGAAAVFVLIMLAGCAPRAYHPCLFQSGVAAPCLH